MKSARTSIRRVLLSPSFSEFFSDNGQVDMMDEDAISNLSVRVKLHLTVWDFIIPATPSLPAVFGVSSSLHFGKLNKYRGCSCMCPLYMTMYAYFLSTMKLLFTNKKNIHCKFA